MKIPMYFDFIQTGENNGKFNGFPIEISKKYPYENIEVVGVDSPDSDIDFIKEDYQGNFYYPLIWDYDSYLNKDKLTIPTFVLKKINQLRAKILILNIYEGNNIVDELDEGLIKKFNLSWENIVILSGNTFKFDNVKTIHFNIYEKLIRRYNYNYNEIYNLIFNEDNLRQNKFICLQRKIRTYRLALYTELYPYKDDGLLTMGGGDQFISLDGAIDDYKGKYKKSFKKFKKMNLIETLPAKYDINPSKDNPTFDKNVEKFRQSYLHIVADTYLENVDKQLGFNEKIYKPIIHFQPFVLFSQPNALSEFRSMGYETFSNILDESYDQIDHYEDRFYSAVNSITEFIKQDKRTLHNIMKDIFPILAHNYYNLLTRVKNNDEIIKAQLIMHLYN